jgi:hypothetical protein
MGIMTGNTGECAAAVAEAGGTVEKPGLVAHIPSIGPIRIVIEIACLTMARAAQGADLDRIEPAWILNRSFAGRFRVRTSGAVAGFTVNAKLARLNLEFISEYHRPGGVAAETAQRGLHRVESAINQVCVGGVTRCEP